MSAQYPEWFIGGPWHGEDKRLRAPNLDRTIHVAVQQPMNVNDFLNDRPELDTTFQRVEYQPQRCVIFGVQLTVWVISDEIPNLNNPYSAISKSLGELIMMPHRDSRQTPEMTREIDRYRTRWDIEREVRRELEATYRQRLMDASIAQRPAPSPMVRYALGEECTTGVYIEVKMNGATDSLRFPEITTYFDQGNDEMSPAWVATAQGVGEHSETKPYTGYGTTERAAIVALAADGLGVYARMVDLEKEVSS
jgi:hypothetical protein